MITLSNKKDCCGCSACFSICVHHAISFVQDDEGFMYPQFDEDKCVSCGLCEMVCPVIKYKSQSKNGNPEIYAAVNTNENEYFASSSGGIFILLCNYVIAQGGIVCGAVYSRNFIVKHEFAQTIDECKRFQGSKYVQSDISGIYSQIKAILKTGRILLFSGTPCQVAGLQLFLRKQYDNLYTCDVICHGVPSPLVFRDYLRFVKGQNEIAFINMKSKSRQKGTAIKIEFTNGKDMRHTLKTNLWNKLYFDHYIIRPSCHYCQFTHYNRVGNITIGDYWGAIKYFPEFHADKMVSLVLLNDSKGHHLFEKIHDKIDFIKVEKEKSFQPQLSYPTNINPKRDEFWKDYKCYGFKYISKKYLNYSWITILKSILIK